MNGIPVSVALSLSMFAAAPAKPSDDPPRVEKPAERTEALPAPPAQEPSLDELLGLPGAAGGTSGGEDRSAADLERKLSGEEVGPALNQAVTLMGDASRRLAEQKDVSIPTQRVQEDIVRRLDQLISSLEKMRSPSSSSSSSSSQPQQGQPQQPNQPQQGEQQEQRGGTGENATNAPGLREGALGPDVASARAAWGQLPERVREMLSQGATDRFSATYQRLTVEYYKRLAEQARNPQ